MKRLLIGVFSIALIFSLSPLHNLAKAEGTDTTVKTTSTTTTTDTTTPDVKTDDQNTTSPTTDTKDTTSGTTEDTKQSEPTQPPATNDNTSGTEDKTGENTPVADAKMEIHRQFTEDGDYNITASLQDAKSAEGTWTFFVDGKKQSTVSNKKLSATFKFSPLDYMTDEMEMKAYNLKVVFEGKVDEKDAKVEMKNIVPDMKLDYKAVGNDDKFTGTLVPAKEAVGEWGVFISDENGDEVIDGDDVTNYKGTSFSHTFKGLKKGKYVVLMGFIGKVDGEDTVVIKYATLEVTEEGNGGVIKAPPSDYKPSKPINKGTVDKIIKNTKKGGPMPKTATSYPTSMAAGLGLLVLGVALLGYRRFANQQ